MSTIYRAAILVHPRTRNGELHKEPYSLNVETNEIQDHRPTMVMLHGYMGRTEDYQPAFERLSDRYNLVAVDLRAHGRSHAPEGEDISWSMHDLAYDVLQALNVILGIERPFHILASSMSTAISQELAHMEPERIQSLFLLAPSARFNLPVWSGIALSLSRVAHLRFIDSFLEGLVTVIAKVIGEGELVGLGIERFNHIDIEFHHKIVKETLKEWDRLNASLELPVFIMSGTKDWIVPHKDSLQLAENLPNSSIIAIEGGDHHLIRLRPDLVLDLVEQWLDDMHSMTKEKQYNDEDLRLIDGKYVLQKGQETILPPVEMAS